MAKFTNSQIAADLNLWNEYFNTSALMTDEDFHAMNFAERVKMLNDAFGRDVPAAVSRAASAFGRMGGSVASPAQRANARRTDRGGGRPATIYIVEIPHQMPVTAYSDTRARIIALSESRRCTSDRPLDLPEGLDMDDDVAVSAAIAAVDAAAAITTLGDALCEIGRDLSGVLCYESTTAARRALRDDTQWTGHQGVAARVALRDQVERNRR